MFRVINWNVESTAMGAGDLAGPGIKAGSKHATAVGGATVKE